jgi:alpha-glucosidase
LIKEASQATKTGSPIIRPVWWIDNSDKNTFILSDQFLVGNDILVAPITDENRFKRDIYVPRGKWLSENKTIYTGPIWLRDYPAPIDKIPYFINQPN